MRIVAFEMGTQTDLIEINSAVYVGDYTRETFHNSRQWKS
jgi:hypothetical protein